MIRTSFLALLTGLLAVPALPAQAPRFHWQPGQILIYRVEHVTSVTEVVSDSQVDTGARLNQVKSWRVLDVDPQGVATLQLTLKELRFEIKSPDGKVMLFDSTVPDKSDPAMREQMARYVEQPLVLLRVDARGKVVEVKECKYSPPSRYESELPFGVILPETGPQQGQIWDRSYQLTLEPPQGTGERYEASQKYTCMATQATATTIAVSTQVKGPPNALADQVPLLQVQPEGEVVFDLANGRMSSAHLRIAKELKGHMGEGSSYKFQSTYTEQYIGAQ